MSDITDCPSFVLEAVEDDDRVHGFVIPNGTITGRMSHRSPNMAQVPSIKSPFGVDCRSCWIVPEGHKLVGIDASSLELRMLQVSELGRRCPSSPASPPSLP